MADPKPPAEFILGVDLDGVVADHTYRFREIMAELRGVQPETMPLERSWDFAEWGFEPGEYSKYHRIAVMEHDMFATMPVIDGAAEALWRLERCRVCGSGSSRTVCTCTGATRKPLRTPPRGSTPIAFRIATCVSSARSRRSRPTAYIDDAPHNIEQLRAAGNTVIAFEQPYNRDIDGLRAANWADVEAIVADLATGHVGHHEAQLPGIDAGADRLDRNRP